MRISIEGIRGSGKSSILKLLSQLKYNVHLVETQSENMWTDLYLAKQDRFALGYNLQLLLEQVNTQYHFNQIHIYENSPYTLQTIWSELMIKKGYLHPEELKLQSDIVDKWGWMPDCIIFLDCPADVCLERLSKTDNIIPKLAELRELSRAYDWALDYSNCDIPVYRVNANDNLVNILYHIMQILCQIRKHSTWFKHTVTSSSTTTFEDEQNTSLTNPRTTFSKLIKKQNFIEEIFE